MTTFSAQPNYSTILNDTITISNGASSYYTTSSVTNSTATTGTISNSQTIAFNNVSGYTLNGATITIGKIGSMTSEEFVDGFPDFSRIQKMCETYPGLKIAYEKFVTTYRLVKDDYDNPNIKK